MEDHQTEEIETEGAVDTSESIIEEPRPLLDPMPATVADLPAFCEEFAIRLHKAVLPGRNRARDKTLLQVLCRLMKEAGTTAFAASERYLSKAANMDRKTVTAGLASLWQNGYILRVQRDSTTHCFHYALVIDSLPEAEAGDALPETKIVSLVTGEFSHDAYHAKAWKRNYRLVYTHLLDHPGRTVAEIAREVGVAYNTSKAAVDWLYKEKMVFIRGKKVSVYDRLIRSDNDLGTIAHNNHTEGKTAKRMETYGLDWFALKQFRRGQRKVAKIEGRQTNAEELDFAELERPNGRSQGTNISDALPTASGAEDDGPERTP